ncbi:MAG: hypothetical protein ACK41C_08460 [Phenylobacterium sp.]|uniref:hypothetical protein n=1 Tax=Phenylobacterium sp. TaxID=1871053 RepID=UPI00391A5AB5
MEDRELQDLATLVPTLLRALEGLAFVARHLHPPDLAEVLAAIGTPEADLPQALARMDAWSEALTQLRSALAEAGEAAIAGFEALRAAASAPEGLRGAFRALRQLSRAEAALYSLVGVLPPISRFFLPHPLRGDAELQARLARPAQPGVTGVMHFGGEPGIRGGFSLYVPEDYDPATSAPAVFALHGGSGNGAAFLWSWLRDARAHGAILVCPTALGETWALTGEDVDTPNLAGILDHVRANWSVDPARLLLSGMSDGGTFAYVSGLEPGSPFTHLAPVAAAFHPMLAQMADPGRIESLPIHIAHGALDWMFPIEMAREAYRALSAAGAAVAYRELPDLSHTYPREINAEILAWMDGKRGY